MNWSILAGKYLNGMEKKRKLEISTMMAVEKSHLSVIVSGFWGGLAYWAGTGEITSSEKCILCVLFSCNEQCLIKYLQNWDKGVLSIYL